MNFPDDDALTAGEAALDPALLAHTWPEDFRAGFVAVVGRPNAGKSTLTNALVGAKVAITSGRPETTRHTVRGVVHREDAQLVLVDTPGLHRPRTLLGERLNEMVHEALADVGTRARREIEELLGRPVFLDLHVKVAKDWQRDPKQLGRLGF